MSLIQQLDEMFGIFRDKDGNFYLKNGYSRLSQFGIDATRINNAIELEEQLDKICGPRVYKIERGMKRKRSGLTFKVKTIFTKFALPAKWKRTYLY